MLTLVRDRLNGAAVAVALPDLAPLLCPVVAQFTALVVEAQVVGGFRFLTDADALLILLTLSPEEGRIATLAGEEAQQVHLGYLRRQDQTDQLDLVAAAQAAVEVAMPLRVGLA